MDVVLRTKASASQLLGAGRFCSGSEQMEPANKRPDSPLTQQFQNRLIISDTLRVFPVSASKSHTALFLIRVRPPHDVWGHSCVVRGGVEVEVSGGSGFRLGPALLPRLHPPSPIPAMPRSTKSPTINKNRPGRVLVSNMSERAALPAGSAGDEGCESWSTRPSSHSRCDPRGSV